MHFFKRLKEYILSFKSLLVNRDIFVPRPSVIAWNLNIKLKIPSLFWNPFDDKIKTTHPIDYSPFP